MKAWERKRKYGEGCVRMLDEKNWGISKRKPKTYRTIGFFKVGVKEVGRNIIIIWMNPYNSRVTQEEYWDKFISQIKNYVHER